MAEEITLKSFPFDSVNVLNEESGQMEPDREYEAEIFRRYFAKFLSNGVYFGDYKNYKENSMKVSTDGGLTIKVATGAGIIEGADFENEEERVFTLERPTSGDRIDRVIVRLDKTLSQRNIYLLVKEGDGTTAASLQRDDNIYEICIAEVITSSTTNLSDDSIVDTRLNKDLCGFVNSLITVDGEELYQEFKNYIETVKENFMMKNEDNICTGKITAEGGIEGEVISDNIHRTTGENVIYENDIVNNLNDNNTKKPLSAYQGYYLNTLIQALENVANNLNYNKFDKSGGYIKGSIETLYGMYANGDIVGQQSIGAPNAYNNNISSNAPNVVITSLGWFRKSSSSSEKYKTDITENIDETLNPEKLYDLPVKQFKYREGYLDEKDIRKGKNILGLIAEDVADIYEPAVQYDEKGQVEMWNAQVMIPALLKLVQNQNKDIQELKSRISKLEEKEV